MLRKITQLHSAIMYWPIIGNVTQNPSFVRNCGANVGPTTVVQLYCNFSVGPMFGGVAYTHLVVDIPTHLVKVEGGVVGFRKALASFITRSSNDSNSSVYMIVLESIWRTNPCMQLFVDVDIITSYI